MYAPINITLTAPAGRELPKEPSFRVYTRGPAGSVFRFATTRLENGDWALSAFAPRTYQLDIDAGDRFRSPHGTVTVGETEDVTISFELVLAKP